MIPADVAECGPRHRGVTAHAARLRPTQFLPGGTAFAETLTRAIVAPGSPEHVTATPATS
jgi:hypothetical protein